MGVPGLSAPSAWAIVQRQGTAAEATYATRKDVVRDADRFRESVPKITSPEALLKDRRTLQFVLESYGLESEINKTAILRKLMTQDPDVPKSLASQMTDPRYRQFARDFSSWATANPLAKAGAVDAIVARWNTAQYEQQQGTDNPGMREALYFKRVAGQATTVPQLMADSALAYVVRVGLGLPTAFASLDYAQQKAVLTKRVNLDDFKDPKKLDGFIKKFLVRYENENGGPASNDLRLQLFSGSNDTSGLYSLIGSRINFRA